MDIDPKWMGTVDYATARINTLILKCSKYPIVLDERQKQIRECNDILNEFVKCVRLYYRSNLVMKLIYKIRIHLLGTLKIPNIKQLLNIIDDQLDILDNT